MRRGYKLGIVGGVVAVIVVGGLAIVDRIAVGAVEDRIAEQVKTELVDRSITTTENPVVTIDGFPFLTQVIGGEYKKISIRITDAETSGFTFDSIDLVVTGVKAEAAELLDGTGQVMATAMTGTAVMGQEAIQQALVISGLPDTDPSTVEVSVADGVVGLSLPLTVYDQDIVFNASGTLEVQDGAVAFNITDVQAEGVPDSAAVKEAVAEYEELLAVKMDVPSMPYGLTIESVETTDNGISVVACADNVVLLG